ncbi:hypothetical protein JOC95_001205 [Bacillus tianshenii]|uniref:Uncharacterized protein n=1 Tax=Sutcliffiella tianshenii TaxID=1463404 RepID=A0ABS2NXH5_9BACI|nr:hypothetical protein [Bacillus tianshenii]
MTYLIIHISLSDLDLTREGVSGMLLPFFVYFHNQYVVKLNYQRIIGSRGEACTVQRLGTLLLLTQ